MGRTSLELHQKNIKEWWNRSLKQLNIGRLRVEINQFTGRKQVRGQRANRWEGATSIRRYSMGLPTNQW